MDATTTNPPPSSAKRIFPNAPRRSSAVMVSAPLSKGTLPPVKDSRSQVAPADLNAETKSVM